MAARRTPRFHLERARQHVAEAEQRVAAQRDLVERMVRDGDSEAGINTAKALLRTFEETLATMRFHLEQEASTAKMDLGPDER